MYWRLLSTDPEAAKDVVLAEKPVIADSASSLDPALLNQLLAELSTLASVRYPPSFTPLLLYQGISRYRAAQGLHHSACLDYVAKHAFKF